MYKIFPAWKLKNAFERASFWWQLSLTTWLSSTFHRAFHARKGFLSSRLSVWQADCHGDKCLWRQVVTESQWMATTKRRCRMGKQKGTVFTDMIKAPATWSDLPPCSWSKMTPQSRRAWIGSTDRALPNDLGPFHYRLPARLRRRQFFNLSSYRIFPQKVSHSVLIFPSLDNR